MQSKYSTHADGMVCCRHFEASRLCGNTETAQNDKVSAGIDLLTGSTAMLLMLLGGSCIMDGNSLSSLMTWTISISTVIVSKFCYPWCRIIYVPLFLSSGSAVGTDVRNSYTARIMVISVMPFIIIQLSQILNRTSPICLVALISLIISVSILLAYCLYQVFVHLNSNFAAYWNILYFQ